MQLIGMLHDVAGLVPQNAHAFRPSPALHVDDHLPLELHQAGVGEIERDRDPGRVARAEPLIRDPGMRPHPQVPLGKLLMKLAKTVLEPGARDRDLQILQAKAQQLLVGQR
jgi:hypothetical protein